MAFDNTVKFSEADLSVIIVSFNTREMTLECLRVVYADLGDLPSEVWVVDNGSLDGSPAAIRERFPQAWLIESPRNVGFGAANNLAIRRARGANLLLLNSDAFLEPGAVKSLLSGIEASPRTAVVGPRLLNGDRSLQRSCHKFPGPFRALCEHLLLTAMWPNHPLIGDFRAWPHDVRKEVDFVIGACMLVRRSAVDEVGLFDEDFFMYAEETDWCYRFHQSGWKVEFVPDAQVVHLGGGSGASMPDRIFTEFRRAQERFVHKHHGIAGLTAFRVFVTIGACLRIALFTPAVVVRSRRAKTITLVRQWARILRWNLGRRGTGLADPIASVR